MKKTLNVLWATGIDYNVDWESSWIKELLEGVDYTIRNVTMMNDIVPNALIVVNHNILYVQYLQQYQNACIPFGLVHVSDEWLNDDLQPYYFSMCKFVYRNYYKYLPIDLQSKVTPMALGYKYGFWNGIDVDAKVQKMRKPVNERTYVWSFAGAVRDNRVSALQAMERQDIHPHKVVVEQGNSFNSVQTGLGTPEYRDLMCDSIFVLCPIGNWNIDSFRIYEALECGAIPIAIMKNADQNSEHSYLQTLLSNVSNDVHVPCVLGTTMEENAATVQRLVAGDVSVIQSMQDDCLAMWVAYKRNLRAKLFESVSSLLN